MPLGSLTYHFTDTDELLREAFTRFSETVIAQFEDRMRQAATPQAAARAVVALITEDVFADHRSLVLSHELYTLAARDPSYRNLTNTWMSRSRQALEQHFDPDTARILDALVEGITIHHALSTDTYDPATAATAVSRITAIADNTTPDSSNIWQA